MKNDGTAGKRLGNKIAGSAISLDMELTNGDCNGMEVKCEEGNERLREEVNVQTKEEHKLDVK